ncbi:predicted protein [Methanosarcina acetivorans C2A]|uniref:Uncharacterized protein n=1 Tax=Methanosarcina acetivorans (strain ATCC 35395 / DSM 2834 / JCM 12185 / C2A) TaxID=188937 RepID=Q8TMX7_METAC|nr:predicted protein [Methanosarcina acetivorans C2A]
MMGDGFINLSIWLLFIDSVIVFTNKHKIYKQQLSIMKNVSISQKTTNATIDKAIILAPTVLIYFISYFFIFIKETPNENNNIRLYNRLNKLNTTNNVFSSNIYFSQIMIFFNIFWDRQKTRK